MAIAELIARLEQDAALEVRQILERAEADARGARAAADQEVADVAARRIERERGARRLVELAEMTAARGRARGDELAARHAQIARVLARAQAIAQDAAAWPEYRRALPAHLDEALSYVDGLQPRVRCSSATAAVVRPLVAGRGGVDLILDETVGPGVIVEAGDGSVTIDNTIAARLRRLEADLTVELSAELDRAG